MAELLGSAEVVRPAPLQPRAIRRGSPDLPPDLSSPTIGELAKIQAQRRLPCFAGLELAARARHLFVGTMRDGGEAVRAWIITDSARRNAQARRMDGKLWHGIDAKAKTLRGSEAAWPVGAADIGDKPIVLLCEGSGDFLAAYFLCWWHGMEKEAAPVAMLGARQRIHPEGLPYFVGKRVLILPHSDQSGAEAEAVWSRQLREAGGRSVEAFRVHPHKDINDAIAACGREMGDDT